MATLTAAAPTTRRRSSADPHPLRHIDLMLCMLPLVLSALGLLEIYSSTRNRLADQGLSPLYYVERQSIAIAIGVVGMFLAIVIDYRRWRDLYMLVYLAVLPLLAGVLVVGASRKGAQAWFQVGPMQFQPSEIAKVALIITIAGYCHQHRGDLDAWRLAVALGLAAVPIGLVLAQNDLGSAAVLGVCTGAILLVAGLKTQHMAVLFLLAVTCVGAAVMSGALKDYQIDRIKNFADQSTDTPTPDQSRTQYNTEQAKRAIASGGFSGTGLFEGNQTKLSYVPEQHTDFIFTVVGEELGFIGGAAVLALYALLCWRLWRIALLASDFFGTLLAVGVLAMFAFQIFENIGMTMGIMPITGLPLPFMSYGGSAVITCFIAAGLAINVHMRRFS